MSKSSSSKRVKSKQEDLEFPAAPLQEILPEISPEESEGEEEREQTTRVNKFAFLGGDGEESSPMEESDTTEDEFIPRVENERKRAENASTKKKKKPRKRKEKKRVEETVGENGPDFGLNLDMINRPRPNESVNALFKIDPRSLNPDTELRRLLGKTFGGRALGGDGSSRHAQLRARGKIVKAKADWPPLRQTGIYMTLERVDEDPGIHWYRFRHNEVYRELQQMFWFYQRQMDHEAILNEVLAKNPYHLDSLLLLAEVLQVQEDSAKARDAIERGLFACESAYHSSFQLLSPDHRLEYSWRENRAFFLLLHRHMRFMTERRCFGTALQFAKIIYAKDPDTDPLAISLTIDVMAICAKDPQFLVDFYAEFKTKKHLDKLPNFLFSVALAHRNLAKEKSGADPADELAAEEHLEEALTRFPFVLGQILDKLQIQPDSLVDNNYYLNTLAFNRETDGMKLLTDIFVHHSLELWRQGEVLSWLEKTTHKILPKLAAKKANLDEWAALRKKSFVGMPRSIVRHCVLYGIRMADGYVDANSLGDTVTDPCPPFRSQQDYEPADFDDFLGLTGQGQANQHPSNLSHSTLTNFLRSLVPNDQQANLDAIAESVRNCLGQIGGLFQQGQVDPASENPTTAENDAQNVEVEDDGEQNPEEDN